MGCAPSVESSRFPVLFDVQTLTEAKKVQVVGTTLGDLRKAVKKEFGVPPFEQKLQYTPAGGEPIVLEGDASVLLKEKFGLHGAPSLMLTRVADPRYKMEKETAFLESLVACRFKAAKQILQSSGVTIDPNCVRRHRPTGNRIAVTECPYNYLHPALTVAIQAGLENAVVTLKLLPDAMQAHMAREKEVCDVVELLIGMKADVNATGDETQDCESAGAPTIHGKTPLCAAVQRGSPMIVKVLLDAKADPNHEMKYDLTAHGPDTRNPLGPGRLRPESWLSDISNGSVSKREAQDVRNVHSEAILELLRAARESIADAPMSASV